MRASDIFVDGVRDPAVSIRENFFTSRWKSCAARAPRSPAAARGGAARSTIVTQQAGDRNFY